MAYEANGAIEQWLAKEVEEDVLEPGLAIVDPVRMPLRACVQLPVALTATCTIRSSLASIFLPAHHKPAATALTEQKPGFLRGLVSSALLA